MPHYPRAADALTVHLGLAGCRRHSCGHIVAMVGKLGERTTGRLRVPRVDLARHQATSLVFHYSFARDTVADILGDEPDYVGIGYYRLNASNYVVVERLEPDHDGGDSLLALIEYGLLDPGQSHLDFPRFCTPDGLTDGPRMASGGHTDGGFPAVANPAGRRTGPEQGGRSPDPAVVAVNDQICPGWNAIALPNLCHRLSRTFDEALDPIALPKGSPIEADALRCQS